MPRHRRRRPLWRARPYGRFAFLSAAVLLLLAAGYWWGRRTALAPSPPAGEAPAASSSGSKPSSPAKGEGGKRSPATAPAPPIYEEYPPEVHDDPPLPATPKAAPGTARIALVIDDLGRSLQEVRDFQGLGVVLSYSVLPFETRTPQVAAELRRQGVEILCHLPMEAKSGANPGPGALRSSMSPEAVRLGTRKALAAVQGAVGVNNHMGSTLTANRRLMAPILEEIEEQRLFFLDSRTSAESVGYRLASEMGLATAERQVFLDPDPSPEAVRHQFHRLLDLARRRGAAIAIGHPHPATLSVLREEIPKAVAAGYEFVPVSYLLDRSGDGGG